MDRHKLLNRLEERFRIYFDQIMYSKSASQDMRHELNKFRTSIELELEKVRNEEEEELRRKPARIAVTDITPARVDKIFRIKKAATLDHWVLKAEDRYPVPDNLRAILNDYNLACKDAPPNEALMRTRIDAILLTTLAATKKRQSCSKHRDSTCSIASVRFQFEKPMKLPWTYEMTTEEPIIAPFDMESNLLVCEAKAHGQEPKWQALIYMAMLHHARKRADREDTSVYGIGTDSETWTFIYLSHESEYSATSLEWEENPIEIVSLIAKIVRAAGHLAFAKSKRKSKSVEEMSGLEW